MEGTSPDFDVRAFAEAVRRAVEAGLDSAAILDAKGKPLAFAGSMDGDEARAIAAHATRQVRTPDSLERMFRNELLSASLNDRDVHIGFAARCLIFVVVFPRDLASTSSLAVDDLRSDIELIVRDAKTDASTSTLPPTPRGGGSSSGPAELPVIEVGMTIRRREPN